MRKKTTIPKLNKTQRKKITKDFLKEIFQERQNNRPWGTLFPSTIQHSYRGTRTGKHNERWDIYKGTADQELRNGELEELRYRCRQLDKDNPIAEGTIIAFQEMAVGDGPFIHAKYNDNEEIERQLDEILEEWALNCDISGEETLNQITRNIVSNVCDNGDVLITMPMDKNADGIQTRIQLIEADRISTPNNMNYKPVRHGVQYNEKTGQVEGYWVSNIGISEQDHKYGSMTNPSSSDYTFFPKYKAGRLSAWLFKRPSAIKRPEQSRQIPLMASSINTLINMGQLIDATVVGERVAACIMGTVESTDMEGIVDAMTRDTDTQDSLTDAYGQAYSRLQPGTIIPLRSGEKFSMHNPNRNGSEINGTLLKLAKDLSMKVRIPYPVLFLDLEKTSFSSYGGEILEARKMLSRWRKVLDQLFIKPVLKTVIQEAILLDMIKVPDDDKRILKPRVAWPAWGYVDPTKEVKAESEAVNNKFTSIQRVCQEHGLDWVEVIEEQAQFKKKQKELEEKHGISLEPPKAAGPMGLSELADDIQEIKEDIQELKKVA